MTERKRVMQDCTECTHAIFDEVWGEYKCDVHKRYVKDFDKNTKCVHYEKGSKKS